MSKDYQEMIKSISNSIGTLNQGVPDMIQGFNALSQGAMKDGALDKKTKELMALAIGVAGHCDGCIGFHTRTLAKLGATKAEVMEALGVAVYMGGGPSLMFAADAIKAFESFSE